MAFLRVILAGAIFREVAGIQLVGKVGSWPGLITPLDEAGYQYLLSTQDDSQLWRYIRRVVATHGGVVRDEASFDRFVSNSWNKPVKQRTYDTLLEDLSSAKFLDGFSPQQLVQIPSAIKSPKIPSVSLFIAGIEGTGHQFFKRLMDSCVNSAACNIDPELTRTLWDSREDKAALTQAWREAAARIQESPNGTRQLRVLNAYDRTDHIGELTYTGMMSYPSFSAQWVPRLDLYSAVANEAGDQLYALVLVRDPATTLCSDFARFHHNVEEEIAALASLVQQLQNLPPSTYRCVDYNALPALPRTTDLFLSELLHSTRTGVPVSDLIAEHFYPSNSTCTTQVDPESIERFAQAQKPLFELCRMADTSAPIVDVFSETRVVHIASADASVASPQ